MQGPARRIVLATASLVAVGIALLSAFDVDISSNKFVRNDVIYRASVREPLQPYPYDDASGYTIWVPSDAHVAEALQSGELPLWNRRQGGGFSPLAYFQHGVFNPLRWAAALVGTRHAPSALILLSLAFGFIGALLLLLERGAPPIAASFGAGCFALSSHAISFAYLSGMVVFGYMPWLAWAYFAYRRDSRHRRFVTLALIVALCLMAGHPLLIFVNLLAATLLAITHMLFDRPTARQFGALLLAAAAGVGVAWFVVQPFAIELGYAWSYKTKTNVGIAYTAWPLGEWWTNVLGSVTSMSPSGSYDMPPNATFFGPLLPGLALIGLGHARRTQPYLLIVLPLSFLLAFPGPWMSWLAHVPLIGYAKSTYLYPVFALALAMTAAFGVSRIFERLDGALRVVAIACLGVIAVVPVIRAWPLIAPRPHHDGSSGALDYLRRDAEPYRVTGLWGQTHVPNIASLTGIDDLRISSPMLSPRYHLWFQVVDRRVLARTYPTMRITNHLASPLIGAFNVRYILRGRLPYLAYYTAVNAEQAARFVPPDRPRLIHPNATVVYRDDAVEILRNDHNYRPRAYFAGAIELSQSDLLTTARALNRSADAGLPVDVVEVGDQPGRIAAHQPAASSTIAIGYPGHNRVEIAATTDREALLVLNDLYAPGWRAYVDGVEVPVYPVNLVSRGVMVPKGAHEVVMRYWPPGLTQGLAVSLITLFALLVAGLRRRAPR